MILLTQAPAFVGVSAVAEAPLTSGIEPTTTFIPATLPLNEGGFAAVHDGSADIGRGCCRSRCEPLKSRSESWSRCPRNLGTNRHCCPYFHMCTLYDGFHMYLMDHMCVFAAAWCYLASETTGLLPFGEEILQLPSWHI
jgi:hypothetical protein